MWYGIQVWGDAVQAQPVNPMSPTYPHGYLKLQNCTIANALDAIRLIKDDGTTTDWSYTGGIVQATNTTFLNNWRSAEFMIYTYPNKSYFNNCVFITNGLLNDPNTTPNAHVTLFGVKGVQFIRNRFKNNTPALYSYDKRATEL